MNILEVIDKLKELDYDEITIDSPDFKLSLRRSSSGSPMVSVAQAPTRIIDTVVNENKKPGLHQQSKSSMLEMSWLESLKIKMMPCLTI